VPEVLERCQKEMLGKYTEHTVVHFLRCMHELRKSHKLVQLASMTGKDWSVENRIILLIDWLPKPFTVTGHLDYFVQELRIEYIPAIDNLCNAIQVSQMRGRFLRGIVDHLVDSRFGQARACPPRILQNEGLGAVFARLLGISFKHSNPDECPAANKASRLPKWQSLRDVYRPTNRGPKLQEVLGAPKGVKRHNGPVKP